MILLMLIVKHEQLIGTFDFRFGHIIMLCGAMLEFADVTDNGILRWNIQFTFASSARGGDSHMKVTGMLVVSLRVVNCRFWSHLGC